MGCGLSEAAATLLRVRVVLMLTFVREPAVMVELANYIAKSPRRVRLGLGLDEAPRASSTVTAPPTKSKKRAPTGSSRSARSDL